MDVPLEVSRMKHGTFLTYLSYLKDGEFPCYGSFTGGAAAGYPGMAICLAF